MKSIVRTAAFAFAVAAFATFSSFTGAVQAAGVAKPKPPIVATPDASPDSHPVPNCPLGDPNGCGIYSN